MPDADKPIQSGERLAKVIARSGLCSRRDAEDWIKGGRVSVNGAVIRTPAFNVTDRDTIAVDGRPIAARSGTRVWLYHKPAGLVVTEKDPEGRPTIFERLAEAGLPRVLTVGRLDLNTEGLLLLTNDGGLKRILELPATGWLRRYRVRAFGAITQAQLDVLKEGIEVDGVKYGPIEATLERQQGSNVWLVVGLREGKNREVKNVLAKLGLQVNRLIRVSYGPFQLGDLPIGAVEVVKARILRDQLGKKLADAAGVDFESEMPEVAAMRERAAPPRGERRPGSGDRPMPSPRDRHKPGRPGSRKDEGRDERGAFARPGPTRRIFFDDGRPPEDFVPPEPPRGKREDRGARGPGAKGDRPPRSAGPPRGDRPERGPRPERSDRPARGPRADHPERGDRPQRSAGPRRGDRPARGPRPERSDRPARGDRPDRPPRTQSRPAGAARPERAPRDGAPGRKPGAPRPNGSRSGPGTGPRPPRPAGSGPRPSRPGGSRPGAGTGPRTPRPGGARPSGARPSRPGGSGPRPGGGSRPPRKPRS
jgi:23S rRNA pseudouridine2605 synthase